MLFGDMFINNNKNQAKELKELALQTGNGRGQSSVFFI